MRRAFIPQRPLEDARSYAPWARRIVRVTGGWMAFESDSDFRTWQRQR